MPKKQGSNYKPTKQEQLNAWKNSNNAYAATIAQLENMKNGWGDHSNVSPSSFGSRKSAPLVDKEGFASRYQTDTIPKLEQQEIDMGIGQDEFMRVANQQNEEKEQKAKRKQEQLDFANSLDSGSKLDLWLGEGYKLNNGEKKEAKQIVDDYLKANPNAKRAMYGTGGASNAYVSMTPEQQAEYQKMATLSNKISASGTIGAALSEEIPFLDELLGKAEDFYGVDDKYGIKAQQENAKTQNGLLYGGTKLASEMGKYAVGGSIAKGIKPIAKLGELTSAGLGLGEAGAGVFTSMIGDQLVDLSLDTLPQVLNDVQDEKDKQQIIRDAVTNFGTNAVFNIIGGAGEAIFDAGKGITKNSDDIAELVEGAAKQTDEATDAIKSLSDRLPGKTQLEMEQEALGRGNLEQLNSLAQEQYALSRNQQDMDTLRKALEEQKVVPKVDEITQKINDVVPQIDNSAEEVAQTSNRQALVEQAMKGNAQGLSDGVKNAGKAVDNTTIPFVETVDDVPKADNAIPFVRNIDDVPKEESTPGVFDTTNGTTGAMRERSYDNRTIVNKTDMPDEIKQEFIDEPDLYRVISNEETSGVADEIMASNDFDGAYSKFNDLLDARDPASIPLGYDLAKKAAENKNYDLSVDILERMSEKLTKAGQFTQAAAIRMMGSDPMAAQRLMQREIAKINKSGVDKFGSSWKKIALNETELEAFKNINKGDTEAIENLFDSVTKRVSKEIPATAWEKIVEATKTSMMLNPRTHIRNTASNTVMVPIRSLSDRVSALGQNAVHLFDKDFKVTQSLVGGTKEQKKIAGQIFDTKIKPKLEGNNEYKEVAKNATRGKQVFNDSMVGKSLQKATLSATSFANNLTGGRLQKLVDTLDESLTGSVMENLRKFDYYLLGAVEDDPFVKSNFKNRLASYMKAQGINAIDDVPDEAVQIAYQEALKATFKDDNYLTKMFSGVKGNLGKFGEVLFPFTKTPANLAKRGIEYSPAGLVESLIQLKKEGKLTTEIVDNLSKNAVGTAGIFIGYELAKNGMINGSLSDNKREKQFQKQQGKQAYSINIGGQSYTFDWAQPGAIPLIIGATIYDAIKASDDEAFEALSTFDKAKKYASIAKDGAVASFDSWADLTPLQSFKEIFGGNGYGDGSTGENIISAVTEFPLRLIPAAAGSTARTVDKTYRETYVKDDPVETLVNQAKAKIPALGDDNNWWNQNVSSKSLPASYDGWGRERTRQDTTLQAAFANFINPGSTSNAKQTEIDPEILRLFEATGDENVFPLTAEYSVKDADKKNITLNNEQHSELQRELGVTSYDLVSNFIKSDAYNTLDDTAKKDAITGLYKAANQYVKNKLYGTEASDKLAKMLINGATPEEVSKYVKMSADLNKYGLTMTEKNIAAYERAMRTGNAEETVNRTLQKESERREVYKANNVNSGKEVDAIFDKAYASGGSEAATQALKQYKQEKQMFSKYGMEDNETARKVYEEKQSEDMLAKYSRLYELGKQKDKIDMLYSDDFESIPTLDKGYLLAQTISGNQVTKPLKDAGNYEAFFAYYDVKRAADENGNDSLNKKEKALAVTYLMKNYGYTKEQAQIIAKEWYK